MPSGLRRALRLGLEQVAVNSFVSPIRLIEPHVIPSRRAAGDAERPWERRTSPDVLLQFFGAASPETPHKIAKRKGRNADIPWKLGTFAHLTIALTRVKLRQQTSHRQIAKSAGRLEIHGGVPPNSIDQAHQAARATTCVDPLNVPVPLVVAGVRWRVARDLVFVFEDHSSEPDRSARLTFAVLCQPRGKPSYKTADGLGNRQPHGDWHRVERACGNSPNSSQSCGRGVARDAPVTV